MFLENQTNAYLYSPNSLNEFPLKFHASLS